MESRVAHDSRVGAGVVLEPPQLAGCLPAPGEIRMLVGPRGYVGLCRLEDGRVDVAAAIDREAISTAGGLGAACLQILRQAGVSPADRLANADWRGTPSLTRQRRPWGERIVAVGDAAGYVEPFTGQGMAWAINSAALLVPLLDAALGESWTTERLGRAWERQHGRWIARQQRTCRWIATALRRPWLLGVATGWLSNHPRWASPLVGHIQQASIRLPEAPSGPPIRRSEVSAGAKRPSGGGMTMVLEAIGTALPENRLAQADTAIALARLAGGSASIYQALCQRAGIEQRHFALPRQVLQDLVEGTALSGSVFVPHSGSHPDGPSTGERLATYQQLAPELAVRAARQAIEASATSLADITHLVTVSCTGMAAPGVDFQLIRQLGLDPQVQRLHVGFMGCHGAINGLRAARGLLAAHAEPTARALLVAVELCSLHVRSRADGGGMVANALFADGAAAVICRTASDTPCASSVDAPGDAPLDASLDAQNGFRMAADAISAQSSLERPRWRLVDGGSMLFPDSEQAMTWNVGDHGFVMTLDRQVPQLIATHLRGWLEPWLERRGISLADVGSWCIHPGGPKILQATADALGLSQEQIRVSASLLAEVGNLSSPTLLFALDRFRGAAARSPCVMLGFGPGLVAEVALMV
jgi:predicted naringenin-chalcone synthase